MKFSKTSLAAIAAALVAVPAYAAQTSRIYIESGGSNTFSQVDIQNQMTVNALGGAVENYGALTIGGGAIFNNNSLINPSSNPGDVTRAGAIFNAGGASMSIGSNATISNNTADGVGGILNQGVFQIADGARFINNSSTYIRPDSQPYGAGGAFYNQNGMVGIGNNALFQGNSSTFIGGAYYQELQPVVLTADAVTTIGDNARFIGNSSMYAGAIYNLGYYNADWSAIINIGNNAVFQNNTASEGGGAIYNDDGNDAAFQNSIINIGSGAMFSGNTAGQANGDMTGGGAIYNGENSVINFQGDATFSNNTAGGVLNDIYNLGTLNFTNGGTVTLDGGIEGTGNITFGDNTTLIANLGTTVVQDSTINFGGNNTVQLLLPNGSTGGTNISLFDAPTISGSFTVGQNFLYDILYNGDGTFNATQLSNADAAAAAGGTTSQQNVLMGVLSGGSANSQFNQIRDSLLTLMQTGDAGAVQAAANAIGPATPPQTQGVETANILNVFNAVGSRFSGGMASGMSSGDLTVGESSVWAQGIVNSSKLSGDNGFKANSAGLALGVETNATDSLKLGVGYAYTSSTIKPTSRESDVSSNTLFVYSQYKPTEWFVNGIAAYTFGSYDNKSYVLGSTLTGSNSANTLALQGIGGYEFKTNYLTIAPQAGLRYLHVSESSWTDSAGQYMRANTYDYLTGIGGVKFSQDYQLKGGLNLRPEVYGGVTYDFATTNVNSYMTMPNGAVVNVAGPGLNRFAGEVGAGLTMTIASQFDLSLNYIGRFRSDYADHTGMLTLKYKF